jgi:hypothetical protein
MDRRVPELPVQETPQAPSASRWRLSPEIMNELERMGGKEWAVRVPEELSQYSSSD